MRTHIASLTLCCLLASPASCLAESWKQLSADMFVDTASQTRSYDAVNVNVKYLYDKEDAARLQKTFRSKVPPAYSVQRKSLFCNSGKVSTATYAYYSSAGAVIASGTFPSPQKTDVAPESRIEVVFDHICRPR